MTANLLLNLLFCVTPRNRSRQVRSISTRYSLKRNLRKVNNKGNTLRELTCVAMVMSFAVNKDALWGNLGVLVLAGSCARDAGSWKLALGARWHSGRYGETPRPKPTIVGWELGLRIATCTFLRGPGTWMASLGHP